MKLLLYPSAYFLELTQSLQNQIWHQGIFLKQQPTLWLLFSCWSAWLSYSKSLPRNSLSKTTKIRISKHQRLQVAQLLSELRGGVRGRCWRWRKGLAMCIHWGRVLTLHEGSWETAFSMECFLFWQLSGEQPDQKRDVLDSEASRTLQILLFLNQFLFLLNNKVAFKFSSSRMAISSYK